MHPTDEMPNVLEDVAIDWKDILNEAKKQSLIGIVYYGIKNWNVSDAAKKTSSPIDKLLLTKWCVLAEKIRQNNLLLNRRTAQVCSNFAKEGFRTSVMKGQGNALLYGEDLSLLRSSGDIDVWVEGGFERVYEYVMKVAPTRSVSQKDISFDVFSDALVEVHYRPLIMRNPFWNDRLQKFFESQAEACFNNRVQLQTSNKDGVTKWNEAVVTTIPFNLVHQLAHIHRHLFAVGVGLRHVMDYYYQLVSAEKTLCQESKDEVVAVVRSIGLERLAMALTWILSEYFGLPDKCQLWKPNACDGEVLFEDIMKTGNFGNGDLNLLKGIRIGGKRFSLSVVKHNFIMSRFDYMDWFWGPVSRIYDYLWKRTNGYTV